MTALVAGRPVSPISVDSVEGVVGTPALVVHVVGVAWGGQIEDPLVLRNRSGPLCALRHSVMLLGAGIRHNGFVDGVPGHDCPGSGGSRSFAGDNPDVLFKYSVLAACAVSVVPGGPYGSCG